MKPGTTTPCADSSCRTTRGYIRPGEALAWRSRGLCHTCWQFHQRHGTLAQFPLHTGPRKLQPTWLVRQRKERLIAMRVAMHEGGDLALNAPLVEGENNTARRIRNAERFAVAYAERQGVAA